jgi:hypothetical protein
MAQSPPCQSHWACVRLGGWEVQRRKGGPHLSTKRIWAGQWYRGTKEIKI